MSDNYSVNNLELLKSSYEEGLVSALVGAGFSKNVYKPYPNWPQLLKDIVKLLHPQEFNKAERERRKYKGSGDEDHFLNELVNRLGPLDIVSDYIRYRGVGHEAIDVYIEGRIPYLEDRDGILYVKDTKIEREALSAHEALLNCDRFRNIYTTNYDNLLEKIRENLGLRGFRSIICNSQDLSNSLSTQSIIKVHGDLRTGKGNAGHYEFDGDKNLLYIIAKEDYETYQQKHEAFSFMMRMAMLQGKFCLVGFSGNDPNFQFWLQWMKDVLDKDGSDGAKVFMVDFLKRDLEPDVKLFYANHRIGVINLLDEEVQNILFSDRMTSLEDAVVEDVVAKYNWKELLTALFIYLKGSDQERPRREQGEYYSLWGEANKQIQDSKVAKSTVSKLLKVRDSLGPQKSVHHQELIVERLLRKQSWTQEEASLFAIAASDIGISPFVYDKSMEKIESSIEKNLIWNDLLTREETLSGEGQFLDGVDDKIRFENAFRLLFSLKFSDLKSLLLSWSPQGEYKEKVALLTAFFDEQKAKGLIESYLQKDCGQHVQKKLLAKQVANLIYGEFPGHYSLDSYYDMGLFSFNEVVAHIGDGVGDKKKKVLPYSIEDHSICLNPGNSSFRESSRLLTYLMNWGYSTYYRYVTCIPDETWMRAFCELFEYFPYATLYYSSLYKDSKLLKRIGQEYAFSRHLHKYDLQKELLGTILRGLGDENLPWQNRIGLLYIASELYVAVKEEDWYEIFMKTVMLPYLGTLSDNADRQDAAFANVAKALDSINQREHVEDCFVLLIESVPKNPALVTGLINNNLNIESLKGGKYEDTIKSLMGKYQMADIYPIVYVMNHYGLLTSDLIELVDEKVRTEGLVYSDKSKNALIQLSYIISSESNINDLKKLVLKKNVWNCGILENGFSEPSLFHIDKLSDKIVWTKDEVALLVDNLEKNLDLIAHRKCDSLLEPLFYTKIADVLISMTTFYAKHSEIINKKDLEDRIKAAFYKECEMGQILKSLASDDEDHLFVAIEFVNIILSNFRIDRTFHEINVILNRALQKNTVGLALVLSEIRLLTEKHGKDMWGIFKDVLLQILRDYKEVDYRGLNLNIASAYQYLNSIAEEAKRQGETDEVVNYWLTNEEVNRFNNVRKR